MDEQALVPEAIGRAIAAAIAADNFDELLQLSRTARVRWRDAQSRDLPAEGWRVVLSVAEEGERRLVAVPIALQLEGDAVALQLLRRIDRLAEHPMGVGGQAARELATGPHLTRLVQDGLCASMSFMNELEVGLTDRGRQVLDFLDQWARQRTPRQQPRSRRRGHPVIAVRTPRRNLCSPVPVPPLAGQPRVHRIRPVRSLNTPNRLGQRES